MDPNSRLKPIPYHVSLRDFLKLHEKEAWNWFASAESQADYSAELRLELLKNNYRLSPEDHAELYSAVQTARSALGLEIPVTVYQGQGDRMNAGIYYLAGEGHIVLTGKVLSALHGSELVSVLAHELAHYLLWNGYDGEYYVMDRLVRTFAQSPRSTPSHFHTARNTQLYTEIFCDRASWVATGDVKAVIRGLLKIDTGMVDPNPDTYLKQVEEVFAQKLEASEGFSHPELFIRVQALTLWVADSELAESRITQMIEGTRNIDALDLLGQEKMAQLTEQILCELLEPDWFQTPAVVAHARLFFPEFKVRKLPLVDPDALPKDDKTQAYLNYLLLDFVVMDPDLEDEPLKQASRVAKRLGTFNSFNKTVQKELKIKGRTRSQSKVGVDQNGEEE